MIVKFSRPGASFKGLAQYLTHDPKAQTSDRVAWTHTLNLANDHIPSAIDEMYRTYRDAELMKEEAGIKRGGRTLEKPVKHVSLNWHPDDTPTREHMIETTESFLKQMGWANFQAVLVAHNDRDFEHVHIELSTVHPETGLKLDDGLERRRAQAWALDYERSQEQIRCAQRELSPSERNDSPSRPAWEAMKEAEEQHLAGEAQLKSRAEAQGAATSDDEVWATLKKQQREEREAFFAGGKDAYKEARNAAFREVRQEFRSDWRDYYAAKRDGLDDSLIADMKAELISQQQEALVSRRNEMLHDLRAGRDDEYAELLAMQRAERANLTTHLAMGEDGSDVLARMREARSDALRASNNNDPLARDFELVAEATAGLTTDFRQTGIELCSVPSVGMPNSRENDAPEGTRGETRAEDPRVKDGVDIGASLVAATLGGMTTVGERMFEGFFDDAPRPKPRFVETPETPVERPRDLFAAAATTARRRAETEEEEGRRNEWWDERRSRARD